jgi:pimeloyl-ACP methyl ester carboxylesterase
MRHLLSKLTPECILVHQLLKFGMMKCNYLAIRKRLYGRDEEDLRPIINTINGPVLFTWGAKDKVVQLSRSKSAIQKFKNYTLVKYPIGHTPYVKCPDDFLRDFEVFLNQQDES